MIGVDTNVLVRLFVPQGDHTTRAAAFFRQRSPSDPAYVSLLALAEFTWVLRRRYKYGFEQIGQSIQRMLDSDDFVLEYRDRVEWALERYNRPRVDFADLLIARASELAGAASTGTYDRDAANRVPGMQLLE